MELRGIVPALTSPFNRGWLDAGRLQENVAAYVEAGVHGLLVLGSTGEAVFLDDAERDLSIQAVRKAAGSLPLLAGVNAEATEAAAHQAGEAARLGADAVLVSTPHYYGDEMDVEALTAHFRRVADASPVPVLLYNVPKFTGLTLPFAAIEACARHGNIAGLKESSGDLDYLKRAIASTPVGFEVFCGAVSILPQALEAGARGGILAAATVFPESLVEIFESGGKASELHRAVAAASATIAAHGVAGFKTAMDLRGWHGGDPRPPLLPVAPEIVEEIGRVVKRWT